MTSLADPGIPDSDLRLIAVMPLHTITTLHGERGLRARLAIEAERLFSVADREKIGEAVQLAAVLHEHDSRQREPFINHLLRVALRILIHYDVADVDITCAAVLHDTVEDHAGNLSAGGRSGALEVLAARFGRRVASLVEAVTNPVYDPGSEWSKDQQYRAHVAASLAACPDARVIKVSDFTDNGVGIIHTTGPRAVRLAGKYAPLVPVLAELVNRADTPLSPIARMRILTQLSAAGERFAALAAMNTGSPVLGAEPDRGADATRSPGTAAQPRPRPRRSGRQAQ